MILFSAMLAVQARNVHCLETMETYLVVISVLSLLSSSLLIYCTFSYKPVIYRISLYLTFLLSVAFVAVLVIRGQALMKPKMDWSERAACLAERRFCDSPFSSAMEQSCCHKRPIRCPVNQLTQPECVLGQVDDHTRECYYCPECKQAVRSFLWSRSRSLITIVVGISGIVFLLVNGFHSYQDLKGKNPLHQAGATRTTTVTTVAAV
ncbi:hypothetical protein LINGRAPRIM_LOCUS1288 [Linum grandiflorum]